MLGKIFDKQIVFNILGVTLLFIFIFIVLFGLNLTMPMNDGSMSHCPFAQGGTSICQMNVAEHLEKWTSAFTAIPQNYLMRILIATVGLVLSVLLLNNLFLTFRNIFAVRYKRYQADHPDIPLFNYLALVLARGILQSKLYA